MLRTVHAGGMYYKGTVARVLQQQLPANAPVTEREAYDPWEAVEVAWDTTGGGAGGVAVRSELLERVSAWELEESPEDDMRIADERRRAEVASRRAARASALAARRRHAPSQSIHRDLL